LLGDKLGGDRLSPNLKPFAIYFATYKLKWALLSFKFYI
jgi:hypothetical protein